MKLKHILIILLVISILLNACDKNERKNDTAEVTEPAAISITPSATLKPTVTKVPETLPTAAAITTPTAIPTLIPEAINLANSMTREEYPVVDGSTATIPLSEAVYQLATGATSEEAATDIVHTKTTQSYYRLMNGEADLLIVYEPSEEVKEYMKSNGINLQIKPIGKDALVFMANTSNTVESLTKEQLVNIYSGKLTNWSEVGGEDKELLAFQRPVNSGSQTLMQKLVMGEVPMVEGPQVVYYSEMEGILKAMAEYTNEGNTLGYSVFYYAKNMYNLPELKFMKVNGVEPSLETIYDNSYPFVNEFYAVIREDEPMDSNAHRIFDWLTQDEGQSLVKSLGYVPVSLAILPGEAGEKLITDQLPEGFKYILQSEYRSDEGITLNTVTVYQNNWEVVRVFHNVSFISVTGLVSDDTLATINMAVYDADGSYSLKLGLYRPADDKFVLPVIYDTIYPLDEEKGYYFAGREGKSKIIDTQGNVLISDPGNGNGYMEKQGEYYWYYGYSDKENVECKIYDSNFKFVREVAKYNTSNTIYSDDGSIIFSKEIFLKHFKYADKDEFYINNYIDPLIVINYDNYYWVLDRELNVMSKHKELEAGNFYSYLLFNNNIYGEAVTNEGTYEQNYTFYDKNGKMLIDEEGNPYNNYISDFSSYNYDIMFYCYGTDSMHFYRCDTGKRFKIDITAASDYRLDYIAGDMMFLKSNNDKPDRTKVYMKDKLLYDLAGNYYLHRFTDNYYLIAAASDMSWDLYFYYLLDGKGNIKYQSAAPEQITGFDDSYIQLTRGNYTAVINYDGQYIIKNITEELAGD